MNPSQPQQMTPPALPNAPPPPPVVANSPTGSKPGRKSATPSFLNATSVPSKANVGTAKLVGE